MKTRIKIVEHGDGSKKYIAQEKLNVIEQAKTGIIEVPWFFFLFLFMSVPMCLVFSFFWSRISVSEYSILYKDGFDDIETAKQAIDRHLSKIETDKISRRIEKNKRKIVKTEYLDYP